MKDQYQIEELSRAIDALNNRKPYISRDGEIKQLVNTAAYVKQYSHSAKDAANISQLSQRISADIIARRRRKRWLSGIVGVAAAVLLFTNVSFQTQSNTDQTQSTQLTETPQVAMVETEKAPATNDMDVKPPINQVKTKVASNAKLKELPLTDQPTTSKDHQQIVTESSNRAAVLMVLPNRSADSVLKKDGVVKQVYGQDTEKEIIVTQRSKLGIAEAETPTEPASEVPATVALKTRSAPSLNKATRSVNGVEVMVEGKQSQAELEQVADSLVPSAQPDTKVRKEIEKNE